MGIKETEKREIYGGEWVLVELMYLGPHSKNRNGTIKSKPPKIQGKWKRTKGIRIYKTL